MSVLGRHKLASIFFAYVVYLSVITCPLNDPLKADAPIACRALHQGNEYYQQYVVEPLSPYTTPITETCTQVYRRHLSEKVDSAYEKTSSVYRAHLQGYVNKGMSAYNDKVSPKAASCIKMTKAHVSRAVKHYSLLAKDYLESVSLWARTKVVNCSICTKNYMLEVVVPSAREHFHRTKVQLSEVVIPQLYHRVNVMYHRGAIYYYAHFHQHSIKVYEVLHLEKVVDMFNSMKKHTAYKRASSMVTYTYRYLSQVFLSFKEDLSRTAFSRSYIEQRSNFIKEEFNKLLNTNFKVNSEAGNYVWDKYVGSRKDIVREAEDLLESVTSGMSSAVSSMTSMSSVSSIPSPIGFAATTSYDGSADYGDDDFDYESTSTVTLTHTQTLTTNIASEPLQEYRSIVTSTCRSALDDFSKEVSLLVDGKVNSINSDLKPKFQAFNQMLTDRYKELEKLILEINGTVSRQEFRDALVSLQKEINVHSQQMMSELESVHSELDKSVSVIRQQFFEILEDFSERSLNEYSKKILNDSDSNNWQEWKEFHRVKNTVFEARDYLLSAEPDLTKFDKTLTNFSEQLNALIHESGSYMYILRARANVEFQMKEEKERNAQREREEKLRMAEEEAERVIALEKATMEQKELEEVEVVEPASAAVEEAILQTAEVEQPDEVISESEKIDEPIIFEMVQE